MSLYALSLFTNRQLLIDNNNPCNFNQLFVPNQVNWEIPNTLNLNESNISYMYCMNSLNCTEKISNLSFPLPKELESDILSVRINLDWVSQFGYNENFKTLIENLGYSAEKFKLTYIFNEWYNKLFKLSPNLKEKYELIKEKANITKNTQLFCAQIRIGGKRPNVNYDKQFNDINSTHYFWNIIRNNFITNLTQSQDWKLFITTDTELVELEAIREFGIDKIIRIPGVFAHVDRESNLGNDCTRIEKPILDFHFMQNCDKVVISRSGFGRLSAWNRVDPIKDLYVYEEKKMGLEYLLKKYFPGIFNFIPYNRD